MESAEAFIHIAPYSPPTPSIQSCQVLTPGVLPNKFPARKSPPQGLFPRNPTVSCNIILTTADTHNSQSVDFDFLYCVSIYFCSLLFSLFYISLGLLWYSYSRHLRPIFNPLILLVYFRGP